MSKNKANFYFMWSCRRTGTPFWTDSYDVVYECPVCDEKDAFESGDCRRVFIEDLVPKESTHR